MRSLAISTRFASTFRGTNLPNSVDARYTQIRALSPSGAEVCACVQVGPAMCSITAAADATSVGIDAISGCEVSLEVAPHRRGDEREISLGDAQVAEPETGSPVRLVLDEGEPIDERANRSFLRLEKL